MRVSLPSFPRVPSRVVLGALACALALGTALPQVLSRGGASADEVAPVGKEDVAQLRFKARQLQAQGNHQEAYALFAKILAVPQGGPEVARDLQLARQCLQSLNRENEVDALLESTIATQGKNPALLLDAAHEYKDWIQHYGTMISGKFERGQHRGGAAKYVNAFARDRVRAMQLTLAAIARLDAGQGAESDAKPAQAWNQLAYQLMDGSASANAWQLQSLTDLATLPDYEETPYYGWYGYRQSSTRGAPVDADGKPVLYSIPKSWAEAKSDGERWRFAMSKMGDEKGAKRQLAQFLQSQFGVQTLAQYGFQNSEGDDTQKDDSGVYAVHTLKENETIAKLATGIKRFTLPEEFDFVRLFKELKDYPALAGIFQNRRQYGQAAKYWKLAGPQYQQQVDQILNPWAQFESIATQPAGGQGASVELRFRNATEAQFEATEINTAQLLEDLKALIRSNPKRIEWNQFDIANLGQRLVEGNQNKYLGKQAAAWKMDLAPRPGHWDKRVMVRTPLKKAGAYWVTAKMTGGNTARIVLWVADTAIVEKQGDHKNLYFVCDAVTGKPIANAQLDFFGYRQDWQGNGRDNRAVFTHKEFKAQADGLGAYNLASPENQNMQWLVTASDAAGRFAYLGFTGVWGASYQEAAYTQYRNFTMTDRPVYRPRQKVQFKIWADQAQYDREGKSPYAGKTFDVYIQNPKGEKVFQKKLRADQYGGFGGEWELPKDAALGVYNIVTQWPGGSGTFRVEEYKKPEYEVKIEAPTEPVALGDKITATVKAKYYFGGAVAGAKVKVKVLRSEHQAHWWPHGAWDWYYGPGYWWFAYDYAWYPGWRNWSCQRPVWDWCPWWRVPTPPPELVMEVEGKLAADGTYKVEIDSSVAKALHGDQDHEYNLTAEVTDLSRRTIVGTGRVLAARKPFKVYAWVDKGHYRAGDAIKANFQAQTLDGKPVQGKGTLKLLRLSYDEKAQPVEAQVQAWPLDTDAQGVAAQQMTAAKAGQYRLSYRVTDAKAHTIEGGYVFTVYGEMPAKNPDRQGGGADATDYRFNDIEIVPDAREYAPGQTVHLRLNTKRADSTVYLFVRPANGVYLEPKILTQTGKSGSFDILVEKRDMPNFFVEAVTVADGKVYTDVREIVVPPEKKVLTVEVKPEKAEYRPGEQGKLNIKVTDQNGQPVVGSAAITLYDKSVEYISGGSNVPEIREFFWKWRRSHYANAQSSLDKTGYNTMTSWEAQHQFWMQPLGVFGNEVADQERGIVTLSGAHMAKGSVRGGAMVADAVMPASAPMREMRMDKAEEGKDGKSNAAAPPPAMPEPTVRKNFADTAYWNGSLNLDANGEAQVSLKMPENLTTWKAKSWVLADACRVGEGSAEVITTKPFLVRLEAPRFFTQKDEVVLSAIVHNELKTDKKAQVVLALEGGVLEPMADNLTQTVTVPAHGQKRVDWRVKAVRPGQAVVRMKAACDEDADATEQTFPVYIHGMLKTESFSRVIRPTETEAQINLRVPAERLPDQSRLEVRYSPTLAGAMVDALPYLVDYPYGCTEQTLNRFLPTVLTQKVLLDMGLDLKAIEKQRTNLNAQEIGDDKTRLEDWKRLNAHAWLEMKNPVFDADEVKKMTQAGVDRLSSMQCADGGWGWFSGYGEQSYPHTTATVVHGLQLAKANGAQIPDGMLERGVAWLRQYQIGEVARIRLWMKTDGKQGKQHADNLDAFVHMVLVDAKQGGEADSKAMLDFLYRDRNQLAVYAKAMTALACHTLGDVEKRDMLRRNIEQFMVKDVENQTAYLRLPENNCWWCWYGSEMEAQAYYLKLLAKTDPKNPVAADLVKYLLNNRRHATYWNSTRDTAVVVEAFADYLKASGEMAPDETIGVILDGKTVKTVKVNKDNLFSFDNKLVLEGKALTDGAHTLTLKKTGSGPLYSCAYLTNFTLEDPIAKAGLEIKVERKYFKLVPVAATTKVEGVRGQALTQKKEKYERVLIPSPFDPIAGEVAPLKSGDLIEVELTIESKNDCEYLCFEDMKPAGCEPVDVRSGYNGNDMGAYVEFRDERVVFFLRTLARGKHSLSYRLRAEIPGKFSALPTKGSAMYAPELKANSDEQKVEIAD